MTETSTKPTTTLQGIGLLLHVRWLVLRNGLRRTRKRFEFAAGIIVAAMGTLVVLVVGLLFAALAYGMASRTGSYRIIGVLLWIVFVVWQLVPLLLEAGSPAVDFRELARYPFTFTAYVILNLAYGFLDPAGMAALYWLGMTWVGLVLAHPEFFATATLGALGFAFFNLVLNRVVFAFFARVVSTRRGRERLLAVIFGVSILMQFLIYGVGGPTIATIVRSPWVQRVAALISLLPPSVAYHGMTQVGMSAAPGLLGIGAWSLLLLPLMLRQVRRNYLGEIAPEVAKRSGAVQVRPGWQFPGMSGAMAAMMEKELRYSLRNPQVIMNLASIVVFCSIFLFSSRAAKVFQEGLHIGRGAGTGMYPMLLGWAMLASSPFLANTLGGDGHGFDRWLLAPVELRSVLAAKNAANGLIMGVLAFFVTLLCVFSLSPPPAQVANVTLGALYAALMLLALGNWVSVRYPKRVDIGKLSNRNVSEMAMLLGALFYAFLGGSLYFIVMLARWFGAWLLPAGLLAYLVLALVIYRVGLQRAASRLALRSAEILDELK